MEIRVANEVMVVVMGRLAEGLQSELPAQVQILLWEFSRLPLPRQQQRQHRSSIVERLGAQLLWKR